MGLKSGKVRAECSSKSVVACQGYPFANASVITVEGPINPVTPTVILQAPTVISSCQDLYIDPTASTGAILILFSCDMGLS